MAINEGDIGRIAMTFHRHKLHPAAGAGAGGKEAERDIGV